MDQTTRTFRIFVSSTFSDLVDERNALQQKVFPRLRDLAAEYGCHFQAIDLRWGVSNEASLDQQAMNICLGEISRCQQTSPRPNFVVLLGNRYGWCPPPTQIPEEEFKQILALVKNEEDKALLEKWYFLDENAEPSERRLKPRVKGSEFEENENWKPVESRLQAILAKAARKSKFTAKRQLPFISSATEQEINSGALSVKDAQEHVFCFFRNIKDLPKNFNAVEFSALVKTRLDQEYPEGLGQPSQKLVNDILNKGPDSSAKDFAVHIKSALIQTHITSPETEVIYLIRQVLVETTAKDFQNLDEEEWTVDEEAKNEQSRLKNQLQDYIPNNIFTYKANWTGNGITKNHIDQLCDDVYNSIAQIILEEIKHQDKVVLIEKSENNILADMALDDEGRAHHKFAEERLSFFVGRTALLAKISKYLSSNGQCTLAIVGAGGTGKSALMAKAIQQTQKDYPKAEIVYRFIGGATPGSSDGRSLLDSLCREISRRYGVDDANIPSDYRDLVHEIEKQMNLACADRPLIIFLDSLDQLSSSQDARSLIWLPDELPVYVSVISSTRPEDTLIALQTKRTRTETLGGLSLDEGKVLLSQWLTNFHRTLQTTQRTEVLDKFVQSQGNPLYLKLATEEARLWTSDLSQPQEKLVIEVKGIIEKNMIERLKKEEKHGEELVAHALGYLTASRFGLAEDELIDLLSRDLQVYKWFIMRSFHVPSDLVEWAIQYHRTLGIGEAKGKGKSRKDEERVAMEWLKKIRTHPEQLDTFLTEVLSKADGPRLPVVLWSRLSFDLAPYLSERMVEGSTLLNFYHRELGDVASAVFLSDGKDQLYHARLAEYFRYKADPSGDFTWTGDSKRGLSELPYHLSKAGEKEEKNLILTLSDLSFIDAKCQTKNVYELFEDFDRLDGTEAYSTLLPVRRSVAQSIDAILDRPQLTIQTVYNYLVWHSPLSSELMLSLDCAKKILDKKPFWLRSTAPLPDHLSAVDWRINFDNEASIQSLSSDCSHFAISNMNGDVDVYSMLYGEKVEHTKLDCTLIKSIAFCDKPRRYAWVDKQDIIHSNHSLSTRRVRTGESCILYHPKGGIVFVNADSSLVCWKPEQDKVTIIIDKIPDPISVLKFSANENIIIYAAGNNPAYIGVIEWTGEEWNKESIQYSGIPIVDLDYDPQAQKFVILQKNRCISIVDLCENILAQTLYEVESQGKIIGPPARCAIGNGEQSGKVFFVTNRGQISVWDWQNGMLEQYFEWVCSSNFIIHSFRILIILPQSNILFYSTNVVGGTVSQTAQNDMFVSHQSEVLACVITPNNHIVSAGKSDNRLKWFTADGLTLLFERIVKDIAAINSCEEGDQVLVGDRFGRAWIQFPDREAEPNEIMQVCYGSIKSLLNFRLKMVFVAEEKGQVLLFDFQDWKQSKIVRHEILVGKLIKILPAKENGLFWTLSSEAEGEDGSTLDYFSLELTKEESKEIVYHSRLPSYDFAVSHDGNLVCLIASSNRSNEIQMYRQGIEGWEVCGRRETSHIGRAMFLDQTNQLLAISYEHSRRIDILHTSGELNIVSTAILPDEVTCMSASGDFVVMGCESGYLISYHLERGYEHASL
jgi:hypothetical protein